MAAEDGETRAVSVYAYGESVRHLLDGAPEDRSIAITHLDAAIAELRDMRMRPALERALGRRELLKA